MHLCTQKTPYLIFDLLHYMMVMMAPPLETLLMDFIRIQTEAFTLGDIQAGFSYIGVEMSLDEIEAYLQVNPFVFPLEGGLYLTRAGAFTGATFSIRPTAREIEGGYLLPGHRCIPFVDSEQASGTIRFSYDNKLLPHKVMEFPLREVLSYFSLFGEEYAIQFILSDPAARDTILRSFEEELPQTVWLTVTDCSDLYKNWGFRRGDLLVAEVSDWRGGIVKIRPMCSHKDNPFQQQPVDQQRQEWYKVFEQRMQESFDVYGPGGTIDEQLARVFFVHKNELCKDVSGTIEDAIKHSKVIGIEPYGVESRLWYKGHDVPAVGPWLQTGEVVEDSDAAVWSGEQLNSELMVWPRVVFDSWIVDGLYRKENNEDTLVSLVLGDVSSPLGLLKKKRLQGTIRSRRAKLKETYNWFADFERGPVRHRLLELHKKVFALVMDLDDVDDQLEGFPQQPLVILTQLSTHIQYMLESLLRDANLKDEDIKAMAASLEGMEYNFEEVSGELRAALASTYKNRFTVIKGKKKD